MVVLRTNQVLNKHFMQRKPLTLRNPRRVTAGRRNRLLRGPLTAEGRERLRVAAIKNRPWLHSTGPRTDEGKTRSANNGRYAQKGERSMRQLRASVADVQQMILEMFDCRKLVGVGD